ncbi:MAG TPA: NADH-quinone oxidoreductase subunit N [Acidimicrobiia bacterium]|nr:NADH-quinone oxidoreductase subunit N [Acidimicrobiia bacterium]
MIATPEISWIAIAPDLLLALGAAAVLLVDVQWKPPARVLAWVVGVTLVSAIGFAVLQWFQAHDAMAAGDSTTRIAFSGLIVMDGFAVFARLALLAATALGVMAGWRFVVSLGRRGAEALALILLATAGFSLMVASNNLIMLFLGLEVGSIALYVLAGLSRERPESDEAAIKYFLLGSFASAMFVYGVALIYAGTRQFEILEIRGFLGNFIVTEPAVIYIGIGLVIAGLGFKVSAAPFHTWAPDVYQGAPAGLVGYMAAVAKVAGFAAIARVLITALGDLDLTWLPVVAGISALSMLLGSVLALVQGDLRRLLAYSGVAHAGFIMTGVVGGAFDAILFYLAVYAIQLVGSFAVVAVVNGPDGAGSAITDYRGLARRSPMLAASFTVLLLGMGGLPLTSGFIAKFGVFTEAWAGGYQWLVIVAVVASVIAFAFYIRVIVVMYMDESIDQVELSLGPARWVLAVAVGTTIVWGIFPTSLLELAADALPL